jgi:hypothetical protein
MIKKKLQKYLPVNLRFLTLFERVWLLSPIAIWFSYRPLIRLGQNSSMNFELSISVLYVLILALVGLPIVRRNKSKLIRNQAVKLVGGFVVISALSILWSSNQSRGILTLGVIGMLFLVFLASIAEQKRLVKLLPALTSIFIASALVMSILAFIQVLAGIWLDRDLALLCRACGAVQFGFARPNVFTIEPQFLANVLLAPAIIMSKRLLVKHTDRITVITSTIIFSALFLTLSRGAIIAYSAGLLMLLLVIKPTLKTFARLTATLIVGFVVSTLTQGFAAVINPSLSTTFRTATSSSINQLSMGVIDLPDEKQPSPAPQTPNAQSNKAPQSIIIPDQPETKEIAPNFDGYVQESTNVRLTLSKLSIQSWLQTPQRILFGVGLGGSGVTLRNDFPTQVNDREIVQNQYVETLLENGIVGFVIFIAIIGGLLRRLRNQKWTWAILVAFIVQWNFFSGYPNALHIYLIFIVLYVSSVSKSKIKV